MMTTAKGLTSGYVPMGAVFIAPKVAEPFFSGGVWWRHGYTYGGHAGAAAASMAVLDITERENLLDEALRLEGDLATALSPLADLDTVSEVRTGLGAVTAIQPADPAEGRRCSAGCAPRGQRPRRRPGRLADLAVIRPTTAEVTELADRLEAAHVLRDCLVS